MFHTFHMYNNFYIKLDNLKIKNWFKRLNILHIVCLFLIIAIALNFVLNIKSDIDVIGDNNAPTIWLNFWGTYLAAIAGFCVIFQNHKHKLHKEERTKNERLVNYIVRQAENNPYRKFTAILTRIMEYQNSTNDSFYKRDRLSLQNEQLKIQIDNFKAELQFFEIELCSIFPKEKGEFISPYAKDFEGLLKSISEATDKTKKHLVNGEKMEDLNMETLEEQNQKLQESTKQLLNNYHDGTKN